MDFSKIGYNKPLYILAFDHRSTFSEKMFNLKSLDQLNAEQAHQIKEFKMLIYKGFKESVEKLIPKDSAAILCDEQFGAEVILDAKHNGYITIVTVEKSGESEFKLQYGKKFKEHIEKFKPTFAKVLIKYNPKDSTGSKKRQKDNLKIISDYTHQAGIKFLLEVLVLPTNEELGEAGNDREEYDSKLRPGLTAELIKDLQDSGIEPDIWKLEGFESEDNYKEIVATARRNGRDNVGLVILGRGAEEEKVDEWLQIGSRVKGVVGFAVGRTIFWDALERFYKGEIGKAETIETVSSNFCNFYRIFTSGMIN